MKEFTGYHMSGRLNPSIQSLLRTLGNYLFLCSSPIQNVAERRVANVEGRVEGAMLKYGPWKTGGAWKHCVPGSAQCLSMAPGRLGTVEDRDQAMDAH